VAWVRLHRQVAGTEIGVTEPFSFTDTGTDNLLLARGIYSGVFFAFR
jgi:hypothetical protein